MRRAAILVSLLLGCGTGEVREPAPPPGPLPYADELRQSAEVAAQQPQLTLRYNPVQCACPPFEVQVGPRWVRVVLESVTDPATPAGQLLARARADLDQRKVSHYAVKGELDPKPRKCAQGAYCLTLSVLSAE